MLFTFGPTGQQLRYRLFNGKEDSTRVKNNNAERQKPTVNKGKFLKRPLLAKNQRLS